MRLGLQRRLSHPLHHLAEARLTPHVRADHQRIDEEPNQLLQLPPRPTGADGADSQVGLAGVAAQQDEERRQQRLVQRRSALAAQLLETCRQLGVQLEAQARPPRRPDRWSRVVGRQLER